MYSVVLLAAVTTGEAAPQHGFKHGYRWGACYGGCYGVCYAGYGGALHVAGGWGLPYGGYWDGVRINAGSITIPECPGVGYEAKRNLFEILEST